MSRANEALMQSYQEIPKAWYEKNTVKKFNSILLSSILTNMLAYYYINENYSEIFTNNLLATGLTAATIYAISALTDHFSTISVFKSMETARREGILPHHYEANELLKNVTTAEDIRKNKKYKAFQIGMIFTSVIIPPVSIAIAGTKFLATINNRRVARRYYRAAEIARGR